MLCKFCKYIVQMFIYFEQIFTFCCLSLKLWHNFIQKKSQHICSSKYRTSHSINSQSSCF